MPAIVRFFMTASAVALLLSPKEASSQQPGALTGTISDTSSTPIPGVRVLIIELGRRTVTDASGQYRLGSLPGGTYTISFSRLGLVPQTKKIGRAHV